MSSVRLVEWSSDIDQVESVIAFVSSIGFLGNIRQSGLSSYGGSGTFPLVRKSSIVVGRIED
jgi:hypothetical protein